MLWTVEMSLRHIRERPAIPICQLLKEWIDVAATPLDRRQVDILVERAGMGAQSAHAVERRPADDAWHGLLTANTKQLTRPKKIEPTLQTFLSTDLQSP